MTVRGKAWLIRLLWKLKTAGSNPAGQTVTVTEWQLSLIVDQMFVGS